MERLLDMASTIPLPTISPTITGSATIGPPPVTSTTFPSSTSFPSHPVTHRVFEHATKSGHITLWVVFAVFVIITLIFALMTIRVQKHLRLFHYITILIPLTAALTYFTIAAGQGWVFRVVRYHHSHKGHAAQVVLRQIYWARYVDWAISSALALLELTVLAGLPGAEVLLALYADIAMILFGFLSAFTHRKVQWGFLAISCLFYLYILFTLVITTRRAAIARNARVGQFFTAFSLYTLVVWALYPVVWVLGEGTQKVTVNTEIVLFAILDILSKGVWGGWLLFAHFRIQESHVPLTGWWIDGSGNAEGTAAERRRLLEDD